MTFGNGKTYREAWLALDDDGSQPARVIAAELGCAEATVRKYRYQRDAEVWSRGRRRCSRCDFYEEQECPIVTPQLETKLAAVIDGDLHQVESGLCLWCWLMAQGIDYHDFYTSGAWTAVMEPPAPQPLRALVDSVVETMSRLGMTIVGVARATGISVQKMQNIMRYGWTEHESRLRVSMDEFEALCAYAEVEGLDYEEIAVGC